MLASPTIATWLKLTTLGIKLSLTRRQSTLSSWKYSMSDGLLSFWIIKNLAVFILGQVLRFHEVVSLTLRALVRHPRWHQFRREQRIRVFLVHLGLYSIWKGYSWLVDLLRRGLLWPLAINLRGRRFPLVWPNINASLRLIIWSLLPGLWRVHRDLTRLYIGWLIQWLRLYFIHNLVRIINVCSCRYISTSLYEMISELLR